MPAKRSRIWLARAAPGYNEHNILRSPIGLPGSAIPTSANHSFSKFTGDFKWQLF